jgi:DNA anti-recombination protein RmuC
MFKIRFLVIGCLLTVFLVDAASAQLLPRRRWARRKAELRSELVYDLSAKLDSDLAREVEAVTVQLQATAEDQVKTEAAKLEQQVEEAVAQLRKQASALVAEETKRLDNTIKQHVTQLQQAAKQTVNAEASKLKQQTDAEVNRLNEKFAEQTKTMQATVDQHLQKLPGLVTTTLQEELKKREAAVSDSSIAPPAESTPTESPEEKTPANAANLTQETSLKEAEE